ncbi:hypothetical protein BI364_10465 [Acidihalobacter yilgarnensis]|uniref:Uncharacterized protein n=1 Tax=Acidihalobacter yilgarnensis TaxID=2819280 RepID=A0A1D8IP98_9GAMM|nr:hypothetical protein BI364_10465 [Acidihalobacter yilgarnensis]
MWLSDRADARSHPNGYFNDNSGLTSQARHTKPFDHCREQRSWDGNPPLLAAPDIPNVCLSTLNVFASL